MFFVDAIVVAFLPGLCGHASHRGCSRSLSAERIGRRSAIGKKTIDLSLLRQTPPREYLVNSGDVLGVYLEGELGKRGTALPIHIPLNGETAPSLGYPVPIRDDGTISLPLIDPIPVRGMTIPQVEQALRHALTEDKAYLNAQGNRILVSLQRPRTYRVLVIRQEAGSEFSGNVSAGNVNLGSTKRGTGRIVNLPAYRNDVLHALAETGGLPGLDAENAIYVIRRRSANPQEESEILPPPPTPLNSSKRGGNPFGHAPFLQKGPSSFGHTAFFGDDFDFGADSGNGAELLNSQELATVDNPQIRKIPIRLSQGETVDFSEEDIILEDGDIVFIESRDTEIFYTGGLLGGGQYTLPRDYDLDVLGAISIAQSQNNAGSAPRSIGGVSALNEDVTISASNVIVLRRLPDGRQIPIQIDLYEALRHPEGRVNIQPGDFVILQYTPLEAFTAFIERHLLEGALFGVATSQFSNNRN